MELPSFQKMENAGSIRLKKDALLKSQHAKSFFIGAEMPLPLKILLHTFMPMTSGCLVFHEKM